MSRVTHMSVWMSIHAVGYTIEGNTTFTANGNKLAFSLWEKCYLSLKIVCCKHHLEKWPITGKGYIKILTTKLK